AGAEALRIVGVDVPVPVVVDAVAASVDLPLTPEFARRASGRAAGAACGAPVAELHDLVGANLHPLGAGASPEQTRRNEERAWRSGAKRARPGHFDSTAL